MSTYVPIQAITLSSATATVTFTGIPQTYTDFIVSINGGSTANSSAFLRLNADSNTLYSVTQMNGNGSTAASARESNQNQMFIGNIRTSFDFVANINVQNYANTTTNKTVLTRSGNAANWVWGIAGLYRSTSAITSISLIADGTTWLSGSTFTLYGIGSGSPKAFGGDEVRTDGTFWYHIFRSSGRFEPVQALSDVDYLVVAGGGGGAGELGGGGGGGGMRCTVGATGGGGSLESKLSLIAGTSYTVTVGAGGSGGTGGTFDTDNATQGSPSVFATITSTGGGKSGKNINGGNGGSGGGGGGGGGNTLRNGGTAVSGQGYNGGTNGSSGDPGYGSGGGGGAGAVGQNGSSTSNGNGGNGATTNISGTSTTYAGGGGGGGYNVLGNYGAGTGGTGGGGNAGTSSITASNPGTSGTANTGGGGGAASRGTNTASEQKAGGNGGSGIVIVRYLV